MRKIFILALYFVVFVNTSHSQYIADSTLLLSKNDMQWWRNTKNGMLIHFGLYAILGRGEWEMFKERIDKDEYAKLKDKFTCEDFNAKQFLT